MAGEKNILSLLQEILQHLRELERRSGGGYDTGRESEGIRTAVKAERQDLVGLIRDRWGVDAWGIPNFILARSDQPPQPQPDQKGDPDAE